MYMQGASSTCKKIKYFDVNKKFVMIINKYYQKNTTQKSPKATGVKHKNLKNVHIPATILKRHPHIYS